MATTAPTTLIGCGVRLTHVLLNISVAVVEVLAVLVVDSVFMR